MNGSIDASLLDPLTGLITGIAIAAAMTAYIVWSAPVPELGKEPLSGLFERSTFNQQIDEALKRLDDRAQISSGKITMLRARVDHMAQVRHIWGYDTGEEALDQIAHVVRADIRETDHIHIAALKIASDIAGDGFVIVVPDATERDVGTIARRLREKIGQTEINGMGANMRLSASFSIAEQRDGETSDEILARAETALHDAQQTGEDQIIAVSEWEEMRLLAPPAGNTGHDDEPGDRSRNAA